MAEQSPCSPHGWSLDTLETHLTARITSEIGRISDKIDATKEYAMTNFQQVKERTDMALTAAEKAVTKAEIATEKRFESVNEFRQTLTDQTNTFMPRAEQLAIQKASDNRIEYLTTAVASLVAKAEGTASGIGQIGVIILGGLVAISTLTSVISLIVTMLHK